MGVGVRTKAWRFTDINKDYSVSDVQLPSIHHLTKLLQFASTYPSKLVVPARISDATLTYAGKHRSKARIPALSYLHWSNYVRGTRFKKCTRIVLTRTLRVLLPAVVSHQQGSHKLARYRTRSLSKRSSNPIFPLIMHIQQPPLIHECPSNEEVSMEQHVQI